jgi:ribosomal-protein-alanine N-acetyltransferase
MTVTIRPMRASDISAVKIIEDSLFPVDAWSEDLFLAELAEVSISRDVVVAELDEEIVGYASLRFVGKEGDVNTVAVASHMQGQSIGSLLMDWLEAKARDRGVRELFLEVRSDNQSANAMYQKRDYERIDIRRNYYGNSIDANIMRKKLPDV